MGNALLVSRNDDFPQADLSGLILDSARRPAMRVEQELGVNAGRLADFDNKKTTLEVSRPWPE
jgi:hypothetical protein